MQYMFLLLILVAAVIGIPWYIKKKKNKVVNASISNRRNKDEVWKAIKQYLKDTGEYGKEIIDSYVAKRNSIDYVNPHESKYNKKKKREEIKIRQNQYRDAVREAKRLNMPKPSKPKERDLYVVCFTTKQTKTGKLDQPRAIECEVIQTKVSKKEFDRKILINGALDYDKEMEWIAPLKVAEATKNAKAEKIQRKQEAKKARKLERKNLKLKEKIDKAKGK